MAIPLKRHKMAAVLDVVQVVRTLHRYTHNTVPRRAFCLATPWVLIRHATVLSSYNIFRSGTTRLKTNFNFPGTSDGRRDRAPTESRASVWSGTSCPNGSRWIKARLTTPANSLFVNLSSGTHPIQLDQRSNAPDEVRNCFVLFNPYLSKKWALSCSILA